MDRRYLRFCAVDPLFYDSPDRLAPGAGDAEFTRLVARPDGWRDSSGPVWRSLAPAHHPVPEQGWKVHVSATPQNAERILGTVAEHCLTEEVAFKHLPSRQVLLARNSKYADRADSGKFVTIYPRDPDQLERIVAELDRRLAGECGPYILSDVRVNQGPVYARYGAFVPMWTSHEGARVTAIRRPDGSLVPDVREPRFFVPDGVQVPACLLAHDRVRRSASPAALPYRVVAALHFSNGGGVYRAVRADAGDPPEEAWWPRSGDPQIVLKEGRPHAGLDDRARDAVVRLDHEHTMLRRLAGVAEVPEVGAPFDAGGHRFLPQQLMPGRTLPRWVTSQFPLSGPIADDDAVADYTRRALAVADRIAAVLDTLHARGVAFGDLHPANVLVDEQDRVSLVDFELAEDTDAPHHGLGAPGFATAAGGTAREADLRALGVLRLWLFQPTAPVLALSRAPIASWIEHIRRRFPVPGTWATQRRADLLEERAVTPALPARTRETTHDRLTPDRAPHLRAALVAGIHAAASPGRADRLFPGDIRQFDVDGLCFGYGAAGVLHALHVAGAERVPEYERWLLQAVDRDPPRRAGFWEGAHGVAYVLDGLGYRDAADHVLAGVADESPTVGLRDGLAGVGLVLLELAERRGDDRLRARGLAVAAELAERAEAPGPAGSPVPVAGLLDGWSGPALLHVRAHEMGADPVWSAHAERALRRDLASCVPTSEGALSVRDAQRAVTLPYLGAGSAGVAVAAHAVAAGAEGADAGGADHRAALPALLAACRTEFVAHAGLTHGAAGLLYALRRTAARVPPAGPGPDRPDPTRRAVDRHHAAITRHLVPHGDGWVVAGHQLLRLSTDVATGNAGLLLALADEDHLRALPLPASGRATPALAP